LRNCCCAGSVIGVALRVGEQATAAITTAAGDAAPDQQADQPAIIAGPLLLAVLIGFA